MANGTSLPRLLTVGVVLGALLCAGAALAEPQKRGGERPSVDSRVATLDEKLDLSDEQAAAIKEILTNTEAQWKAIRDKYADQGEEGRASAKKEMQALRESTNTAIKAKLTEEQVTKYRGLHQKQGERPKGKGEGKKARGENKSQ